MSLAPIIERYMSFKRQERTICSKFISMTLNTPLPIENYTEIVGNFSAFLFLLRDEEHPAIVRIYSANVEYQLAQLAAPDEVMVDFARKAQETRVKLAEISRMKREIKEFLQQM